MSIALGFDEETSPGMGIGLIENELFIAGSFVITISKRLFCIILCFIKKLKIYAKNMSRNKK